MQQVVNSGQAVWHAELPFEPAPQVLAATNAVVRLFGEAIEVLANLRFLVGGQVATIAAAAAVLQTRETVGVVPLYPLLHRAAADAGGFDDLRRGLSLPGQDHNQQTPNHRGPLLPLGKTLQLGHRIMLANVHARLLA